MSDTRIRLIFRENNGNISEATNSALSIAQGEWVVFLDQDDLLQDFALHFVVQEINSFPDSQMIYTDEDKITADNFVAGSNGDCLNGKGLRYDPHFKPDWNPFLILSQNYICHFLALRRDRCLTIGGLRKGLDGVQD